MSWSRPPVTGIAPAARCAHAFTSCCIPRRDEGDTQSADGASSNSRVAAIFGGWDGKLMRNDLFLLDLQILQWSSVTVSPSSMPSPRAGHTMSWCNGRLYLFGGGDGVSFLNDIHVFDLENSTWSKLMATGPAPSRRTRHSATVVDSHIYIMCGGDGARVFNDVYVLDTEHGSWSQVQHQGTPPCARWGHSATLWGSEIFVFGGHDGQRNVNDMYAFDVRSWVWRRVSCTGLPAFEQPPASAVTSGKAGFGGGGGGGDATFGAGSGAASVDMPSARAGHTMTLVGDRMVLFGGGDGAAILNDLWLFSPASAVWERPVMAGAPPTARCAHTVIEIESSKIMVFGGGDGSRKFKDVYILDVQQGLRTSEQRRGRASKLNNKAPPKTLRQKLQPPPAAAAAAAGAASRAADERPRGHYQRVSMQEETDAAAVVAAEALDGAEERELRQWLAALRVSPATIERFVAEEITFDALPSLTEEHLKALGVDKMGARLRVLAAIAERRGAAHAAAAAEGLNTPRQRVSESEMPTAGHSSDGESSTSPSTSRSVAFSSSLVRGSSHAASSSIDSERLEELRHMGVQLNSTLQTLAKSTEALKDAIALSLEGKPSPLRHG